MNESCALKTLEMDQWPQKYPSTCNCQGSLHKLFKNCLACGLIYCIQNAKLTECSFCGTAFDKPLLATRNASLLAEKLAQAEALKTRLVAADSDATLKGNVIDREIDGFLDSKFFSASEMEASRAQIEEFKAKREAEREKAATFNLSQMLFTTDTCDDNK